jgi:hypothetical protein
MPATRIGGNTSIQQSHDHSLILPRTARMVDARDRHAHLSTWNEQFTSQAFLGRGKIQRSGGGVSSLRTCRVSRPIVLADTCFPRRGPFAGTTLPPGPRERKRGTLLRLVHATTRSNAMRYEIRVSIRCPGALDGDRRALNHRSEGRARSGTWERLVPSSTS